MLKHKELISQGEMETARILLRLLIRNRVTLGFSDAEYAAEIILEKLGCVVTYSSRYLATFHDYSN